MFGVCVIASVSVVGLIWLNSFEKNLYSLLNPDQQTEQRSFAESENYLTPFASLGRAGKDLVASITDFLNMADGINFKEANNSQDQNSEPRLLPISGNK